MIGLDLVYVNPLRNMPKRRLERYAEKVCLPDEKNWVLNAEDPYLALGWLWSVKESAYKIWNRKVGKRSLNPRKFHISPSMNLPFLSKSSDTKIGQSMDEWNAHSIKIQTPEELLIAKSLLIRYGKEDYVLSLSVENPEKWPHIYWEYVCFPHSKSKQSERLREIFQERLRTEKISPSGFTHDSQISFSHDGSLIGYAFTINKQTYEH